MTHGKDNATTPEAQAGQDQSRKVMASARLKVAVALRLVALAADELGQATDALVEDEAGHSLPSPAAQGLIARMTEQAGALLQVFGELEGDAEGMKA